MKEKGSIINELLLSAQTYTDQTRNTFLIKLLYLSALCVGQKKKPKESANVLNNFVNFITFLPSKLRRFSFFAKSKL